jgi:hypothetical protein
MHRLSFLGGAAAAFIVSAASWNVLQSAPVKPMAADGTLGMAMMGAIVSTAGELFHSTGVESVLHLAAGTYAATFVRPLIGCIVQATPSLAPNSITPSIGFTISASHDPNEPTRIVVVTRKASSDLDTDAHFQVMAFCPK